MKPINVNNGNHPLRILLCLEQVINLKTIFALNKKLMKVKFVSKTLQKLIKILNNYREQSNFKIQFKQKINTKNVHIPIQNKTTLLIKAQIKIKKKMIKKNNSINKM